MSLQIAENTSMRTIETLINEAKALGLRVVHKPKLTLPEPKPSNVVDILAVLEKRRMQMCQSAEA